MLGECLVLNALKLNILSDRCNFYSIFLGKRQYHMDTRTLNKETLIVFHPAIAPYRVDFFNAIHKHFETKFFFSYRNVQDQKFDQELLMRFIDFNPLYMDRGFSITGRAFRFGVFSILRKEHPNIVICSEFGPITFMVFFYYMITRKKYRLYTISDDSISNSIERNGLRAIARKIISKNINGVIYASREAGEWNKKHVSKLIKPLELPIIHNDNVFRKKLKESLPIAEQYLVKYNLTNKKVALFVGRLVKEKNLMFLIDTFSKIDSKDAVLVIVGSGPLEKQLIGKVKSLNLEDKIISQGRLEGSELYAWYNIAQIFVLPSLYEPFGAVVNEALLAGCNVLCSSKAGASTLINDKNGDIFDPYNEEELTEKLYNALSSINGIKTEVFLRKNKMPFSFNDKIEQLINNL